MLGRCQSPISGQPAVALTFKTKDGGGSAAELSQDLAVNLDILEAQLTPAVRKEVEALLLAVLRCMPDRSASSQGVLCMHAHLDLPVLNLAGMHACCLISCMLRLMNMVCQTDEDIQTGRTQQPQRTTRFTVRSIALEAASDCMASHEQPSMYASDLPMEAVSAVGRAEDVSVLVHSAGQQSLQCWPLPTAPSTHVDVSMVSAGLTLFGPGASLLLLLRRLRHPTCSISLLLQL